MKYLIISADDLGLSDSINRGIIKSYEEGVVTALNVLSSGDAFYDAMALLRQTKPKEISAHLALTETSPVSDRSKIPTLLAGNGRFYKGYAGFVSRLVLGVIDAKEIYIELKSQMERLRERDIPVTSISSHQHIHMLPGITEIFIQLAKEYNVPAIRYLHNDRLAYPYNAKKIFKKLILGYFDNKMKRAFDEAGIKYTDNFLGFLDSGNVIEEILIRMLNGLSDGTTELIAHPGFISAEVLERCIFHRTCETDLAALTSRRVKKVIDDNGIKLITFGELAALSKK
ncbi:MAG: ChbG/HpnK family deacetylase [Candidatus Omnitrophica bacterium]|nr:ChbG/HpnK family deacetylase [Candidatus Omnitrophota bacterium]